MAVRKAKTVAAIKPKAASNTKAGAKKTPVKSRVSVKAKAAPKPKAVAKPAAKKTPVKKPASKKPASKKPVAKKSVAKKSVTKKARLKAVDRVVAAARTVNKTAKATPGRAISAADAKIITELGALAKYIRAAKRQISAIRPDDVKDQFLPKAADELDAVVEATAEATNTIMDGCEVIESVMGEVTPQVSAKLMDATTRMYEACTFQDITGQRIGKVVTTMKHIEERVDALIDAFGPKNTRMKKKATSKAAPSSKAGEKKQITDAELLEGPQLSEQAKSQAEIDDLFASFD